jgi:hypothetical protein
MFVQTPAPNPIPQRRDYTTITRQVRAIVQVPPRTVCLHSSSHTPIQTIDFKYSTAVSWLSNGSEILQSDESRTFFSCPSPLL